MRSHVPGEDDVFFEYNGILFLRKDIGGFDKDEAKYLLPRVIRFCRDSYVEARSFDIDVGYNGSAVKVRIRGRDVVRAR